MNNGFFNSDFDSIFRRMMQDMQGSNQVGNKKYYINGKEVSPEELAQLTHKVAITLLNKVRKLFNKQHKDNKGNKVATAII